MSELFIRPWLRYGFHILNDYYAKLLGQFANADLSIFHQFAPPPSGGGHQFLRALWSGAERRGIRVENNSISHTTKACLLNSFNFDEKRLRRLKRESVLYVHRVDGPVDVYRGRKEGIDRRIWQLSHEFADKTIFQSQYSLQKHLELGLEFKNPIVILNAADPNIFHPNKRVAFSRNRKIRLIATSWSDNLNKGADIYRYLDKNLDWDQFEFTFIGRSPITFENIRMLAPMQSTELANQLRQHDIYITASKNDPCSNSLIEALTCGLPAIYLKSGGHPEIIKNAGLGFDSCEEIPVLLQRLVLEYETFQRHIDLPTIEKVVNDYLDFLGIEK